ncbi:MAG TPA: hypothetical protein VH817_21640 [Thermoleophilaceae bacterium]|jgi:predicted RNase H-like HicB family nuclease
MAEREHISLTLIYEEVENGWVQVRLEEFPEVVTAAPTRDQARLMVLDALHQYLASFGPDESPIRSDERVELVPAH